MNCNLSFVVWGQGCQLSSPEKLTVPVGVGEGSGEGGCAPSPGLENFEMLELKWCNFGICFGKNYIFVNGEKKSGNFVNLCTY